MDPKDSNLPGGCKKKEEFLIYLLKKIDDCIVKNKSREETANHLWENFQIQTKDTRIIWDRLEKQKQEELNNIGKNTGESSDPKDLKLPGGCKSMEKFEDYLIKKVKECEGEDKSKIETEKYLWEKFKIDPRYTGMCFIRLRDQSPEASSLFVTALRRIHEHIETEKKASEEVTATQVDSSIDSTKTKELNLPGGCKSMEEFADYIITKIKELREGEKKCFSEIMDRLSEKFEIDRRYTRTCLFHLEDESSDLSSSLVTDLGKIYEQIETERKTSEQVIAPAQATQVDCFAMLLWLLLWAFRLFYTVTYALCYCYLSLSNDTVGYTPKALLLFCALLYSLLRGGVILTTVLIVIYRLAKAVFFLVLSSAKAFLVTNIYNVTTFEIIALLSLYSYVRTFCYNLRFHFLYLLAVRDSTMITNVTMLVIYVTYWVCTKPSHVFRHLHS